MPVLESTATQPQVDTTATPTTWRKLASVCTGDPAQRHDGINLMIMIDIGPDMATFHCQETEKVGAHKTRHVRFQADAGCKLCFTDPVVFGMNHVFLKEGEPINVPVLDRTNNVSTFYFVEVAEAETTGVTEIPQPHVPPTKRDPVVVVP